jgi:hypothetical protein
MIAVRFANPESYSASVLAIASAKGVKVRESIAQNSWRFSKRNSTTYGRRPA